jgi:heterodisulfide reductase subunit B2
LKYYSYYPGCCMSSTGYAKAYGVSTESVNKVLDIEFVEVEDWNCCGSTPYSSLDELTSLCLTARNLAIAEKRGLDLVAPCSSCYVFLSRTNIYMKQYPAIKAKIDEALAAGGLEYHGTVRVRKVLDVYTTDIGFDTIKSKVKKPLTGLKVAPYYGCQEVRPRLGFDDPENPQSMDKLIASLGAEPVPFPLKSQCCGSSLIISEEKAALELIQKLLESALSNGAECMVTGCPLCQMNLDAYQSRVNKMFKTNYHLPILFFTQLMGVAYGFEEKDLGLRSIIVPADKVLVKYK